MILNVQGLTYRYPKTPEPVLHGLDFGIQEGEIFGFLGPNGSGKSTTQKLLTRILTGYTGNVQVFGRALHQLDSTYYNHIGVCFEFPNLYEKLTAEENLEFYRAFFDVPTDSATALLTRLDLPVADPRQVGQYSKGMKMRLVLARSLLNRPRLWFLDEPTTGQDPQHAVEIRKLIRAQADAGTTVFLTTHNMTVAEELCHRVAFLSNGQIVVIDTPHHLKLTHTQKLVRVEYRAEQTLQRQEFRLDVEAEKQALLELIRNHDIETIHTLEPSLEEVFLKLTGRDLNA